MFRSIKSVLFSLLLVVAFTSCDKEVSEEHGDGTNTGGTQSGTADFTLDGSPLECTAPLISGDYIVGTALDISNTVTLSVNVTTVGTYTISTGLINGMQFVASGTFSASGPQTISLFGTGTPTAAMTASFEPGIAPCTFYITSTTGSVTPVGGLHYDAIIDGSAQGVDVDTDPGYQASAAVNGTTADDVTISSSITTTTQPRPANTTELRIDKGILHSYTSVSNVTFKSFIGANTYPFGHTPNDGVSISWGDQNGVTWTTYNGTGDQTGSVFTIDSATDEPGQTNYTVRVTAHFNCILYDPAGNAKTLTNGEYVGLFSKL